MQGCEISSNTITEAPSFRDPAGHVILSTDRVIRVVNKEGARDLMAFLESPIAQKYVADGRIVGTRFDTDPVVVGRVWQRAAQEKLDILPLVASLSSPTPATGWRNRECPSFLERTRGRFDCVLMLAVIHHLLVTDRVPLSEILDLAAELTIDLCVVEFIDPDDSMFKRLVRGRDHLFSTLNQSAFEAACGRRFNIVRSQHVFGTKRWLYLLRKKATWEAT